MSVPARVSLKPQTVPVRKAARVKAKGFVRYRQDVFRDVPACYVDAACAVEKM